MAWLNMGLASIATAKEMAQIADHRKTRKIWRIVQFSAVVMVLARSIAESVQNAQPEHGKAFQQGAWLHAQQQ